ncbi:MAG: peroxiredoxin [Acidobacteria bacterium]|nr:peroxiredoxin [Acidobacteriota bacterium]MCI0623335.1 peroxiredoxin [Acidobacteriota bacterium]MCI0721716.1 peroxiredoxin [Acidobacteriota bacterium]
MKRMLLCLVTLMISLSLLAQTPGKTSLKVGDLAPDFTLPSTAGQPVKLSDFRGKKNVVLAFYPAAFTGGCTKEMQAYQFNLSKFEGTDTQVFGVSTDNTPSQKRFAEDLKVSFPMLSDFATRKVSTEYGLLIPERGIASRATFVIDKEGRIQHIEEGNAAIDVASAASVCSRLVKK